MTRYDYTVSVEANTQEEADQVMAERIDYDEEYEEVGDYTISFTERDGTDPTLPIRAHGFGEQKARTQ